MIVGLLPVERVELVATAHSLALGDTPEWGGLADVNGDQVALDDYAAEIGKSADEALILTSDAVAEMSTHCEEPFQSPIADDSDFAALDKLRARRDDIAEQLACAETLTSEIQARVASARANVDTDVFVSLDAADHELRHATEVAGRPDRWTDTSDAGERITYLDGTIAAINELVENLPNGDRVVLAEASAMVRAALADGDSPLPGAVRIIEELSVLDANRKVIEARFKFLGFDTGRSQARLESAEAAMYAAKREATPRPVSQLEAKAIELAHDEMFAERRKVVGGLRRGSARSRMESAHEGLQSLLDSIGYTTWSQYRVGNGDVFVTEESVRTYELSMAELEAAESEWATVTNRMGTDPDLAMVDDSLASARLDAQRLLGRDTNSPADIGRLCEELAELTVDPWSRTFSLADAIFSLRAAMDMCGASAHGEIVSPQAVAALGESWLAVLRDADAAMFRLAHTRRRWAIEVEALRELAGVSTVDHLDDQRQAVRDTEVESQESIDAMCALVDAQIELHVLTATKLSMAEEHDDAVDIITSADQTSGYGSGSDRPRDGQLGDMVVRGAAGPLPVLVMASGEVDSRLDALLDLPDDVQVIVIADAEPTVGWVQALGDDRVGVVRRGDVD